MNRAPNKHVITFIIITTVERHLSSDHIMITFIIITTIERHLSSDHVMKAFMKLTEQKKGTPERKVEEFMIEKEISAELFSWIETGHQQ